MAKLAKTSAIACLTLLLTGTRVPYASSVQTEPSAAAASARTDAEQPRAVVDIPEIRTMGRTIRVPAGGNLQQALDAARAGDRIELEPGATYKGPFRLKPKDGDQWVVITSSGSLPKPGRHVQPADAASMPKLVAEGDFVVRAESGAQRYRFV